MILLTNYLSVFGTKFFTDVLIPLLCINVILNTIRFEVHHFDSKEKKQPSAAACFSLFWEKYLPGCWNLKDLVTLSYGALTTCVKRFPVSLSCPVWNQDFLCRAWDFPGFAFDPWFIFCAPSHAGEGSSNVCWEGTSGALLLSREKREWCQRACCRQHLQSNHSLPCPGCNIWKGGPQTQSHLGAPWLVKHLLVRSLQSDFDWRWKSHLNPPH